MTFVSQWYFLCLEICITVQQLVTWNRKERVWYIVISTGKVI